MKLFQVCEETFLAGDYIYTHGFINDDSLLSITTTQYCTLFKKRYLPVKVKNQYEENEWLTQALQSYITIHYKLYTN